MSDMPILVGMARTQRTAHGILGVMALGAALMGTACVDNQISFFIRQVQAPLPMGGGTCSVPADPSANRVFEGILDVGLRDDYHMAPLLVSQIAAQANMQMNRPETAVISVEGFVIEIHEGSPDGPIIDRPFTVYQSSTILPPIAGQLSYGVTDLQVIPPSIVNGLRARVCTLNTTGVTAQCPVPQVTSNPRRLIVRLLAFGHTLGTGPVETPTFDFPVNVCCGCLVNFPTDADTPDMVYPGPDCNNGTASTACNVGQDAPVDCRLCAGTNVNFCQPRGYSSDPTSMTACPR